jgi:hypothetical protein
VLGKGFFNAGQVVRHGAEARTIHQGAAMQPDGSSWHDSDDLADAAFPAASWG